MGKKKDREEKKDKPLEERTIKELREEALKSPDIHGVYAMNKEELLIALRKVNGIPEPEKKTSGSIRELKAKFVEMRKKREEEREQSVSRKRLDTLRRRLSKLKKQIRHVAA